MFDFQSHLVFPVHAVPAAGPLPRGAEKLSFKTPEGALLAGVHIPADEKRKPRTLILGFGGNAWNAQDVAEYLHELFPDDDVVAFHYRGYRPSSGDASAEALIADAPLVHDFAVKKLKPDRVILVGLSIGSGIAASVAAVRKTDGLVLVTPFDSLKGVAQSMYPWLPIGPFFAHEVDAAAAMDEVDTPTAIISAAHDEIVPADRTEALRPHVANLVLDRTIARAGHNDIYKRSDFQDAMREAVSAMVEARTR